MKKKSKTIIIIHQASRIAKTHDRQRKITTTYSQTTNKTTTYTQNIARSLNKMLITMVVNIKEEDDITHYGDTYYFVDGFLFLLKI
jgi:esterase/lipase